MSDEIARQRIKDREILNEPWSFTDDTVMAIGIYRILEKYWKIDQDELAKVFAENYASDWHRGYGGTAHSILRSIGEGKDWRAAASEAFDGMGSLYADRLPQQWLSYMEHPEDSKFFKS